MFGRSDAYEFVSDGRRIGELWWDQDASSRETLGWYLRDFRQPWRVLPIDVNAAVTAFTSAPDVGEAQWLEDADTLADQTADVALALAEALLETGAGASPSRCGFEIHVGDLSVLDAALSFPALATREVPDGVLLCGRLSEASLLATLKRIRALGGRVVSVQKRKGTSPGIDAWFH